MAKNIVERKKINGLLQAIYRVTLGKLVLLNDSGTRTVADLDAEFTKFQTDTSAQMDKMAPLKSPALTGTPTAPTAETKTNSDQIATTKFVNDLVVQNSTILTLLNGWTPIAAYFPKLTRSGRVVTLTAVILAGVATSGTALCNVPNWAYPLMIRWFDMPSGRITLSPDGVLAIESGVVSELLFINITYGVD